MVKWIRAVVPGLNLSPYRHLTLFSVLPSSTPRPRRVVHQLLSLSPAQILIVYAHLFAVFFYLFTVSPITI